MLASISRPGRLDLLSFNGQSTLCRQALLLQGRFPDIWCLNLPPGRSCVPLTRGLRIPWQILCGSLRVSRDSPGQEPRCCSGMARRDLSLRWLLVNQSPLFVQFFLCNKHLRTSVFLTSLSPSSNQRLQMLRASYFIYLCFKCYSPSHFPLRKKNPIPLLLTEYLHHYEVGFFPGMQGWLNTQKSLNVIYYINKLKEKLNGHLIRC
jgi:hypothetical protein